MKFFAIALLLLGILAGPSTLAAQVRDGNPRPSAAAGTGSIGGRVTERDTGRPLIGITVTLGGPSNGPLKGRPLITHTDGAGTYSFTQLGPGPYSLTFAPPVNRATHLAHVYGERRPSIPRFRRPYSISLRPGQRIDDADVALWRAYAISGRVIDENGEPIVNADVHAFTTDGLQISGTDTARASDDRGAYRIFGLPPGRYQVCADAQRAWDSAHSKHPVPIATGKIPERPVTTCHPSALREADAQLVTVITGDAENVDIRMRRSRTFTVSGVVLTSSGTPFVEVRPSISIIRLERKRGITERLELEGDGRFIVRGLTPGNYLVAVDKFDSDEKPGREVGRVPFTIDNSDLENLVVVLEKAAAVSGRVIYEEPPDRAAGEMRVTARMDPSAARLYFGPSPDAEVRQDLTFELRDLFGPRVIGMTNLPRNYHLKRVMYGTEDITDIPFEFKPSGDPKKLEILLSNRGAFVTGSVLDEKGNRAEDAVVLVFPADRARWPTAAGVTVRSLVPQRGDYSVGPFRAGEYFIVAVSGEDREAYSGEPEILEQLSRRGQRVLLAEGERRSLDLRLVTDRNVH